MIHPSPGAALAALLVTVLIPFPQTRGLHLVSNQAAGTDNQNNPPVQYVPKMITKLGISAPQNREAEILTDDSLASAIRQLMEGHKRQTAFIERLAALAPWSKPEDFPQYRKTAKPSASQSVTKHSEGSVIMRPGSQRIATEKVVSPETIKMPEVEVFNKTEDFALVSNNSPSPPQSPAQPQKILQQRTYVTQPKFLQIPPDFHLPSQDPAGAHPPHTQTFYPQSLSDTSHTQSTHTYGTHPTLVPKASPFQNTNYSQRTPSNLVGEAPHSQNPSQPKKILQQRTYVTQPQFLQIPPDFHLPSQDPLSDESPTQSSPHETHTALVPKTHSFQSTNNSQRTPSNLLGEAPYSQNPSQPKKMLQQRTYVTPAKFLRVPSEFSLPSHDPACAHPQPQAFYPQSFSDKSHTQDLHTSQGTHATPVPKIPLFQDANISQRTHSNLMNETPQSQNVLQDHVVIEPVQRQDSFTSHVSYLRPVSGSHQNQNSRIPQRLYSKFKGEAPHSQKSPIVYEPHPKINDEASQSQKPHMAQETLPLFVGRPPHNHFPFKPVGFHPPPNGEVQYIQNPILSPQIRPHNGQYPYSLYSGNMRADNVGQPLLNDYNRRLLVNPHLSDVNAQHYNYFNSNRSQGH